MKKIVPFFIIAILFFSNRSIAQLPDEQLLWPGGLKNNPITYKEELSRSGNEEPGISQRNLAFSCIATPTYIIHKPEKANGVAMVICPGGGFREVWFDQEGNDIGLLLAKYGITSLVLKYRTFNSTGEGAPLSREEYNNHVYADGKKALLILHDRAEELGIDKNKIGIAGFSAGGALSLFTALELYEDKLPGYAQFGQTNISPDFTCLVYPEIRDEMFEALSKVDSIPPMFIVNGRQDNTTPALKCLKFYQALLEKNVYAGLHIYAKAAHGFDSGLTEGYGVSMWIESFIAWLKDAEIMKFD